MMELARPSRLQAFPNQSPGNLSGLVNWLTFDDLTVWDSSGNPGQIGLAAASGAAPQITNGVVGNALKFSGTNYVGLVSNFFSAFTSFSALCWVNPTGSGARAFIGDSSLSSGACEIRVDAANTISLIVENVALVGTSSGTAPNAQWTHVAVTYDGTNYKFYINGAGSGSGASAHSFTSGAVAIGYTANGEGYTGAVDDVRLYNRILSEADINTIYNSAIAFQGFSEGEMPALYFNNYVPPPPPPPGKSGGKGGSKGGGGKQKSNQWGPSGDLAESRIWQRESRKRRLTAAFGRVPAAYFLTLSISASSALTLSKAAAKTATIASSAALSLAKSCGKSASIASASALSVDKGVGKSAYIASASTLGLMKSAGKGVIVASSATPALAKAVARSVSIAALSSITVKRGLAKTAMIAAPSSLSLVKAIATSTSIASSSALTIVKNIAAVRSIAATASLSLSRAIARGLVVSSSAAIGLGKSVSATRLIASSALVSILARLVAPLVADPRFISLLSVRRRAATLRARIFGSALKVRRAASQLRLSMPQGPDFSPMDVGETINGSVDFARWLPAGVTISEIVSVVATNYDPPGGSAYVTLSGAPATGTSPITGGGSGVAGAGVLQQWTGVAPGIARITAEIVTSDGQTLIGWSHQPVLQPN